MNVKTLTKEQLDRVENLYQNAITSVLTSHSDPAELAPTIARLRQTLEMHGRRHSRVLNGAVKLASVRKLDEKVRRE